MSLRVWLPLNGNTNNQGLSGIIMAGSPDSYDVNGKIGKCASFAGNTTNIIYYNTSEFNYTDNFSYCVWINQNFTGTAQQWAFANGRADYGSYGYGIKINSATDISCFFGSKGVSVSCPTNEWHHIAVTISGTIMKVYKDGILDSTNSTATLPTYSDGNGLGLGCIHYTGGNIFPFYGSLNDFRIYDHCLSPKEVKEISKGLCLHYQLKGFGQENLAHSTSASYTTPYTSFSGVANTCPVLARVDTTGLSAGDTLHVYLEYKYDNIVPTSGQTAKCWIQGAGDVTAWNSGSFGPCPQLTLNGSGIYIFDFTITLNANHISNTYWSTNIRHDYIQSGSVQWKNFKVEKGSVATPWCPNSADSSYSSLGFDSNIELDYSGFGNNGTRSGTITCDIDSPRYTTSYHFSNSQSINYTENLTFLTTSSISFWAKFNAKGASGWLPFSGQDGNYFIMATSGGTGNFYNGGITAFGTVVYYEDSKIVSAPTNDGKWHHYAITGVNMSTWTVFKINKYSDSLWNSDVNYADVRVYNTILSAEDILELYNSPINIDNKGNLYAYEFIEEDKNNFSKQGIAKNSEFIDLDTAGDSYTNASISSTVDYANIFIEK